MAEPTASLVRVLEDEVTVTRQFWITARQEQRRLARVRLLWDFLREALTLNREFLMGDSATLMIPEHISSAEFSAPVQPSSQPGQPGQ